MICPSCGGVPATDRPCTECNGSGITYCCEGTPIADLGYLISCAGHLSNTRFAGYDVGGVAYYFEAISVGVAT